MSRYRSFPQSERQRFTATFHCDRVAIRMQCTILEKLFGLDEFALGLRGGAMPLDPDLECLVGRRVEQINAGSTLIDDPPSIRVCPAREVFLMVCMPAQVLAGRGA